MNNIFQVEVRERYGATDAYREHEQKTKNYTKEKWAEINDGLMAIFAEFAACKALITEQFVIFNFPIALMRSNLEV